MKKITFLLMAFLVQAVFCQSKLTSSVDEFLFEGVWQNNSRTAYMYDANNNLSSETYLSWDETTSTWVDNSYRELYSYNANNKITQRLSQNWDETTNVYNNSYRSQYTYNSQGRINEIIDAYWSEGEWKLESRTTLDFNGNQISVATFFDRTEENTWETAERLVLSYNANGIQTAVYEERENMEWKVSDRDVYTRNSDGKIIQDLLEVWNGTSWDDEERTTYTLDANGNRITETYSFISDNEWVDNSTFTYSYDTSMLMANIINPFTDKTGFDYLFEDFPFVNKVTRQTYDDDYRTTYNYDEGATASVIENQFFTIGAYPNPTTDIVRIDNSNFDVKSIELFNVLGKKVLTTTASKFSVKGFSNGIYLIKVTTIDGRIATERLIKQ